ncbi:tRNA (adenosine(37)-N6)-dimethylallyltransferase MiaA [Roseimarinus sediminis]|jgi:tRNA dimethylallyltransferase|uniref:tRNA (adenosine(37)-N6)-dimethylallyltransferase MiaA n=1 Tax=Roseimarinus sediminis TaxID=1610899 RepID=UPI003D19F3D1
MDKTLIVIVGPTGIGKTSLSIAVAQQLKTEIISADSRQIYRELRIGTAVPDSQQLHTVKHNFIQSHSIHQYYNAAQFESEVIELLDTKFKTYNEMVMTGGSMMYIDAVCDGIDDLPKIDHELRKEIIAKYETEGLDSLRRMLKKVDPDYYATVDLKNHKRIMHALEIYYLTGKPYSSFRSNTKQSRPFQILKIGLNTDRQVLHQRINQRVDQMVADGLVEEARTVYPHRNLNSLNTVGYRELFASFDGATTEAEAIELIKRNSRRYARRQLTWFRKDESINWFEPDQEKEVIEFIKKRLDKSN